MTTTTVVTPIEIAPIAEKERIVFLDSLRGIALLGITNYLMQSLLCGIIFYGVGFGLFGQLQRYEIYYVVLGIWIFQIFFSRIWLRYFLFGPLEWAWRSLTYWKIPPLGR
jgi:uncharacterized protein